MVDEDEGALTLVAETATFNLSASKSGEKSPQAWGLEPSVVADESPKVVGKAAVLGITGSCGGLLALLVEEAMAGVGWADETGDALDRRWSRRQ